MADETRTTQYLYEFVTAGIDETEARFQAHLQKMAQYEQQMQDMAARMGKSATPTTPSAAPIPAIDAQAYKDAQQAIQGAQQAVAAMSATPVPTGGGKLLYEAKAIEDGRLAMTEYRKELGDTLGTLERSKTTYDNFGGTLNQLTEKTWVTADGVKHLKREIETPVTPGIPQTISEKVDVTDSGKIVEVTQALNDNEQTVVRTKTAYDQAGNAISRFTSTASLSRDGMREVRTEMERMYSNVPRTLETRVETRDGKMMVQETTKALNDQEQTVIRTKEAWDANGVALGKHTTTTKTLADGTKSTTVAIEGMSNAMKGGATYSEQFIRHLKWISQGIVLWAGINAVTNALGDWWRVQKELNQSLAEFEMRTAASPAQLEEYRAGIMSASQATGVSPVKLAQVAPYAAEPETLEFAGQLQRVAGGDIQNQMQWLVAQQRQFNVAASDTSQILSAMASGWRLTTLPMSQFLTMLRDAAPLAQEFNLSMEETYSMFGALQQVTGAEGKELDYLVRNMAKLYEPGVQRELGIQTTVLMPDGNIIRKNLIAVLDEMNTKIKEGEISIEEFAALFGATGRGQRQQIQRVMLAWDTFMGAMGQSMNTPAEWSSFFETQMDTAVAATDSLKAAWERLMMSVGDTDAFTGAIGTMTAGLELLEAVISGKIDEWAKLWDVEFEIPIALHMVLPFKAGEIGKDIGNAIGEGMNISLPPWLQKINDQLEAMPFIQWVMKLKGIELPDVGIGAPTFSRKEESTWTDFRTEAREGGGPRLPAQSYEPSSELPPGPMPLDRWPSMTTVPLKVDFGDVMADMDQWVRAFSALGPEFAAWVAANQELVTVYDENTGVLRTMTVFLPALQRAISENTDAVKESSAIQPGLRTVDMNLNEQGGMLQQWIQYYTQYLDAMGFPQESKPQLIVGEDDTFLRIWASNEALMLALRALTEATEEQTDALTGMWNVPEGATMWVPIQSLFYSRKPGGDEGGAVPFLPPPTEIPEKQPDWMDLPGAVDQMNVNTLSVMNAEGLFPIPEMPEVEPPEPQLIPDEVWEAIAQLLTVEKPTELPAAAAQVGALIGEVTAEIGRQFEIYLPIITKDQETYLPTITKDDQTTAVAPTNLVIDEVQASTLEIQSPVTDVISPNIDATAASMTSMISSATMTAGLIDLSGIVTGLDFSDMTSWLAMIYDAIVNLTISIPPAAPPAAPYTPTDQTITIDGEVLGRVTAAKQYDSLVSHTRQRAF